MKLVAGSWSTSIKSINLLRYLIQETAKFSAAASDAQQAWQPSLARCCIVPAVAQGLGKDARGTAL
jgi:hypothetical protein